MITEATQSDDPPYSVGTRFVDVDKSTAGAWEITDIQWEERWRQGDGAWAYYLAEVGGDRTRHVLLSGLQYDIRNGHLELDESQRRSDGGYPAFSDASVAQRARTTSAFRRSRGGVTPTRRR